MKQVEDQELELKNLNAYDIADIEDQYGISGEKSQSNSELSIFDRNLHFFSVQEKPFRHIKFPLILLHF